MHFYFWKIKFSVACFIFQKFTFSTDRKREIQTDKETDGQRNRQTKRQRHKETDRHKKRQKHKVTDRKIKRQTNRMQKDRQRDR